MARGVYLAAISLLAYSFFPLGGRRWQQLGIGFSLLLPLALAGLLMNNRPLYALYAPVAVLVLMVVRLFVALRRPSASQHQMRWLFLLTLSWGLLFASPDFASSDDGFKYLTAEAMVARGQFTLPPAQKDLGSSYSRYALGHSVLEVPLIAAAIGVEKLNDAPPTIRYVFVNMLDPIVTPLGVALLFLCARRMFGDARVALALSLIYYFATFALAYAVQSWTEPMLATLLLLAFYAMLRAFDMAEANKVRWLLIAGVALGYALFCKEEFALVAAIFGLWWLMRRVDSLRAQGMHMVAGLLTLLREGLFLALPLIGFYIINLAYNYLRTGSLVANSYAANGILAFDTPLLTGLYGLLLSPGKGLVWLAPPLLLLGGAGRRLWRGYRWEAALVLALFVVMLVFYATYHFWEGGTSWGPRYLLPFVPLLMLLTGAALASWGEWRGWQRMGYQLLVTAGVLTAVVGMLVNPSDAWLYGRTTTGVEWDAEVEFSVAHSLIVNAFGLVGRGWVQPQAVTQLSYYHLPYFADQTMTAGLLVGIGVAVVVLMRQDDGLIQMMRSIEPLSA